METNDYYYEENAFDYPSIAEGAKKEIVAAIEAWKDAEKPNCYDPFALKLGQEVLLQPYNRNGKLSFGAFCWESEYECFLEFKKGGEELPEIDEVDISEMECTGEEYVYGNYYVHTNIDF